MSNNTLNPGDSIDGYRIIRNVGEGGFGVVYEASDRNGRRVAIKVLRAELVGDPSIRERLSREVTALSAVSSDRVAKIISSDLDGSQPLIVMEFVEGLTLDQHVKTRGPLTGAMATSVALAIAEGLRDVHSSGVVHRDLKPSNIMLGPDGVKILDFGIALLAEANDFTRTGTVLGSTIWMSPEQISGETVGTPSDVFALGLVVAFALIGAHPYGDGRPEALMYRIDQGAPDLSSVSGPLKPVVEALLRRQVSDRPGLDNVISQLNGTSSSNDLLVPAQNVEGQAGAVPPPVDRTTVLPTSSSPEPKATKKPKKRKVLLAFAGLLLVANGIVWPLYLSRNSQTSSPAATTPVATSTTVKASVATTTIASTPTTTRPVQVATTTLPPTPVYKLYEWNGYTYRWNQCQNPISIFLNNSDGSLTYGELAAVGSFLGQQALELTDITGHLILYRGLTDEKTSNTYKNGEKILIQISDDDSGLPLNGYSKNSTFSYDRSIGSVRELDAWQIHLDSAMFSLGNQSGLDDRELSRLGKNLLMFALGEAFGLAPLETSDFAGFGVTNRLDFGKEKMWWGGMSTSEPVWGPGDQIGMILAQSGSCF